jgi:hypothetical protein
MDPSILINDLQQKTNFKKKFSAYYFLKVLIHHFWKVKSQKKSQNTRNPGFSYYFCILIEGSGVGSGSIHLTNGSGSIPVTNGSGYQRPKNTWIRKPQHWFWACWLAHSTNLEMQGSPVHIIQGMYNNMIYILPQICFQRMSLQHLTTWIFEQNETLMKYIQNNQQFWWKSIPVYGF